MELVFLNGMSKIEFSLGVLDLDMAIMCDEPTAITDGSNEDEIIVHEAWSRSNRLALMFMRMCVAANIKTSLPEITKAKEYLNNIKDFVLLISSLLKN